ncbi:glycoside hydrolase family 2 [Maribellus comscasis]|uniref:Glycoside hydrolase family 2 n=1 Tax=Maribellus comscasis TaxID=2681766 RepID=A0A6I6JWJ5_9BACT|nr:glycoside hydrolase family 2 TIM barrel-domain containing protein [Maribellus comscasis]QGY47506.1 glycoside hydrolase family 2 [Maribellus comscasis]
MKQLLSSLVFLSLLVGRTQAQCIEESLNGIWHFLASNDATEKEILNASYSQWDTITVPGNWDTREHYSEYKGKGYYQRNFDIPKFWKGKQVRITFDAVYETAKVWLNGQLLGEHVGGYTPFEFNITDKLQYRKTNQLIVMADNTYQRGAWWPWGGISRDITLLCNEDVRMVYQHISAIPDFEENTVNFIIRYKIENKSNKDYEIDLATSISSNDDDKWCKNNTVKVKANGITFTEIKFIENLSDCKLWQLENPFLYQLKTQLKVGKMVKHNLVDNFGIRKIEVRGEQLFFNNKPFYANGFNRVHDHPAYGNSEPDELIKKDIDDIIALGGRFSRLMHAPLSKNILDYCDKVGYLIVEEIPVWGKTDPQTFPDNPLTKQWLKEMVDRDFNHPCVVGYSVGNELGDSTQQWNSKTISLTQNQFDYVNSMLDYLDELDTTRLKTYVSFTSYRKQVDITREPYEKLDFLSFTCYGVHLEQLETVHSFFPGKPIFIAEMGKGQLGHASNAELKPELVQSLKELKQFPFLIGASIWTYNDYRSNYRGTPESGYREWGVVDAYRNPKKAYYQLKEMWSNSRK